MVSRRALLKGAAAFGGVSAGLSSYAFGLSPMSLAVTRYSVTPKDWPKQLGLRIVALADVHACEPWMSADRVAAIVERANSLQPDMIVLLGDYMTAHRFTTRGVPYAAWSEALGQCRAPLGVHAVLGNHDWWDDVQAQRIGRGPIAARRALERVGIPVYENDAVRLSKNGQGFWLAGLGDQLALLFSGGRGGTRGVDDLFATMSKIEGPEPVILMAHEPDVFPIVPDTVALTLSGHTHGGQVRLLGHLPVVPSRYGNRYAYGHIVEGRRHLVVSGGLGCSVAPVRVGVLPEIVVVEVGAATV